VSDIHIVRTDQIGLYNAGEIFNPAFIDKISEFDTLRFMDWMNTNDSAAVTWEDRTLTTDSTWGTNLAANQGVPLEVMVALANQAHTDMWYNVPTQADNAYVKAALTYIRDHLDPSLQLHVEYSNEVWNSIFEANAYAKAQGIALFGADTVRPDEVYYGYRSAQIAAIGNEVFGDSADTRLVNVIATQAANPNLAKYIVQGITAAGVGTVTELFSDYAIATYFGLSTTSTADRDKILSWAQSGDAGIAAAFNEMLNGGTLSGNLSLARAATLYAAQEKVAQSLGLDLVAYEGGLQLVASKFPADQRDLVTEFFHKLANDPQMGKLYTTMVDYFTAAGGDDLVAFNDVGSGGASGQWGSLTSIYDDGSPRYDALILAGNTHQEVVVDTPPPPPPREVIEGTSGDDTLKITTDAIVHAGAGNDKIYGGSGAPILYGGTGDDIYIVDTAETKVIENAGEGKDTVWVSKLSSYTLTANVENLAYQGKGNFHGIGNELGNRIAGGVGNDILEGGAGDDNITGGAGDDILIGGSGSDNLTGGTGADKFVFQSFSDFGGKNAEDVIYDFSSKEGDKIDLSGVDANTLLAGDQAFTFLGTGAFTKHAGELNYVYSAKFDKAIVSGDIDGDGVADFSFWVLKVPVLTASDFIL
jgi:Ca2+-binding RTX toxin-like protein